MKSFMQMFLAAFGIVALMLAGCESADDTDVTVDEDEEMMDEDDAGMDDADEMDAESEDEM